ncbi:MAG TPA: MFS transporter [Bryobacteraceae bacterium]|nr:MFS transporter [Bryobacteraceae bacterium]
MIASPRSLRQPADARRRVIAFGMSLAFLSYLDRACISQAAPMIARDLHFNAIQMGYIFSAFGLTYAAMEIPSGWLIDRYGPRLVLTRVVICWSFFTAATGLAWNFASMLMARLLFGAGEAGCFPGLAKAFSNWLPAEERAHAEGWKASSARWGAAAAPLLVVALYARLGWRVTFALFGAIGLVWAGLFYFLLPTDRNEESAKVARQTPWRIFLRSRSAWALCVQWFCHFYGFYFYVTWLPTYLLQARGLSLNHGAILSGLPLLTAGCGCLFAGYALQPVARWCGIVRARKAFAYVAYGGAALFLLLFTSIHDPNLAMIVMSLSSFIVELSAPVTWTTAMDLGGQSVGLLTGMMNTLGHLGGSVAPTIIGYLLAASGNSWDIAFYASAALYALGGLCWLVLDPVTPLDRPTTI